MLENYMEKFSRDLELDSPLHPQMQGTYMIPLEEDMSVVIIELQPQGFDLKCTVAPCPKKGEEAFFTQMLLADLFGQGTRGAVLGLDLDAKQLLLSRRVDYHVEYRDFRDILEDFINAADFWREEALSLA